MYPTEDDQQTAREVGGERESYKVQKLIHFSIDSKLRGRYGKWLSSDNPKTGRMSGK